MNDFKNDLKNAQKRENEIKQELEKLNFKFIEFNHDNKYDLKMSFNNKPYTFEIKTDLHNFRDTDSGNVFIETECRGKESGISVTKADFFVIYLYYFNEFYVFRTNVLKDICYSNEHEMCVDNGDDGSVTKGFLVNRAKYFDKGVKFDVDYCDISSPSEIMRKIIARKLNK